jgi:signal transduction histidine kinase
MGVAELRTIGLLDGLDDAQLADLLAAGETVSFEPGERLFEESRPADHWWLLLEGSIALMRRAGNEESVIGSMTSPGQWAGGFRAWDEHGVYMASGRGLDAGRVLRIPADRLRALADGWFPFGVHLLQGLVHTARNIESMARQREALVALGTLAAGLAHEINNPASAATRAVDALETSSEALLDALRRLGEVALTAEQFVALDRLRLEAAPPGPAADPMLVADREEVLSDWMADHGIDRDWVLAPSLAAAGLDTAWCARAAAVVEPAQLQPALDWVAAALATTGLLVEVKESTRRISELVGAVRSYSQLDRAALQRTAVTEGLDSTLMMLSHRLKDVRVQRDYGDVPAVDAYAGELNQVWTNIIDNAVDAMDGSGTLRVSARADDHGVVVEITDSGPGMPEHVRAHAFEPFFTTKDVGKGTGLGLDITRRIVCERHGGDIEIDSRPGRTAIRVRLPLVATSRPG